MRPSRVSWNSERKATGPYTLTATSRLDGPVGRVTLNRTPHCPSTAVTYGVWATKSIRPVVWAPAPPAWAPAPGTRRTRRAAAANVAANAIAIARRRGRVTEAGFGAGQPGWRAPRGT